MAPQFNIVSNIPTTTLCFDCQISSFNPYTTSYYSSRISTNYDNIPSALFTYFAIAILIVKCCNSTPESIETGIQSPRPESTEINIQNPRPEPTEINIQSPRPAPKKRKNLNNDELALYPIAVVTEKMFNSDNNGTIKSSTIISKSKHIFDDPNDGYRSKILKSASNMISNSFTQVKSDIFGSNLNTSNEAGSNQEEKNHNYECLICFEIINLGDKIRIIPCLHRFHQECLDTWLTSRSGSCPNCRYDLRPQQGNYTQENFD
ncbi:Receptor homology region, transmembrane domain- and RING domain-containing protein 2 [Smittium culicis]|uniref:RING-type E3 ubiquitin transferase n=1 Tax=Smittium culicis TaxID=133412 RepID=A0A1R1YF59_9FUNG|nr:Receptor homology region, transmembrane domain- and RING domain-containing protein 2 [Smittium culicis]